MHKAFKPVRQRILRDSHLLVNLTDLGIVVLSLISVQSCKATGELWVSVILTSCFGAQIV